LATRDVDYLLIGGGVAAAACAEELRRSGADGSIVVVGREEDPPYDRPPLSKEYLAGASSREDALFKPAAWWLDNDIELLVRKSVMKVDPDERVAKLPGGDELRFAQALLATGANVRRLRDVEGTDADGVHYLRAFANADAIRADAESAERVVLIGGSWIGCEVAATLASMGKQCSLVMMEDVTVRDHLGPEVGRFVQRLLEAHGVEVHADDEVERLEADGERVARVVTRGGLSIDAQCVVIGAGVQPDVLLARSVGVEIGSTGGFACSQSLETSLPGVWAAGDVAEWDSPLHGRPARVEHWDVALEHGRVAARAMMGKRGATAEIVPYFWSDLADWAKLEYVGLETGTPVIRGSLDDGDFTAFYLADDGRLVGAATVGRREELTHARRLIHTRATPDRALLGDMDGDLSEV
jgi:3-phenylpropionate/trans-cinnamate dioxygenase ferredoxin reductase subunit